MIEKYLASFRRFDPSSHKGQNGKVMVIGGSDLFHAASAWALEVVASMVDMVFYSSVPVNNDLILEAKKHFWSGVVVPRGEIENYCDEAEVILIGPGMTRNDELEFQLLTPQYQRPSAAEWNSDTYKVTNFLLSRYPQKKWVIDAGALQMVDPRLLSERCIITPHQEEFERLRRNSISVGITDPIRSVTLLKGEEDKVQSGAREETISGGNAGMTKGGTGDVLAGLLAGLLTRTDDLFAAAVVASSVNKQAGDRLYRTYGPFFSTHQLIQEIPKTLKDTFGY